jgi:hypothetical protein
MTADVADGNLNITHFKPKSLIGTSVIIKVTVAESASTAHASIIANIPHLTSNAYCGIEEAGRIPFPLDAQELVVVGTPKRRLEVRLTEVGFVHI